MKGTNRYLIYLHIIGCVFFLSQPIWLYTGPPGETDFIFSRPMLRDFTANGLMLGFFYLHFYLLIPRLYFKKKHILYLAAIVIGLLVICLVPSYLTGRDPFQQASIPLPSIRSNGPAVSPPAAERGHGSFFEEIKHHVFLFASVIFFSLLLRIRNRWYKAETARHQAELSNLKGQINPHFLFNTLNSIYALAVKQDAATADAILNLSGLMRYVIKDAKDNRIPLWKELEYIENYIDLQRSRLGKTAVIDFAVDADNEAANNIAPLILISFIENAFKYGVNPEVPSEVFVRIKANSKALNLLVHNSKVVSPQDVFSSGIGISNTRERLELLYPGKYHLDITEDAHNYQVNLSIDLV
jgi:hypothetical protein